jgi:hypothetical protein
MPYLTRVWLVTASTTVVRPCPSPRFLVAQQRDWSFGNQFRYRKHCVNSASEIKGTVAIVEALP